MVSYNHSDETILSMQVFGYVAFVAVIVSMFGIVTLLLHFKSSNIPHLSFKLYTIIPLLLSLLFNFQFCLLFNNSLVPAFHIYFNKVIDEYCQIQVKSSFFLVVAHQYCLWLFFLSRIYYFCKSSAYELSIKSFYCWNIYIIISSIISCIGFFWHCEPTVYYASNNNKYKLCHAAPSTNTNMSMTMIAWIINDSFVQFTLLYLFVTKAKQLEKAIAKDSYNLSNTFSGTNTHLMNSKIMKRSLMSGIILIIITVVAVVLYVWLRHKVLLSAIFIAETVAILSSFDIKFCSIYGCSNRFDSPMGTKTDLEREQQHKKNMERERYLKKIMEAYYAHPNTLTRVQLTYS